MAERALAPAVPSSPAEPAASSAPAPVAFGSPAGPRAVLPLPPPPGSRHATYVVKVQKDQIYRVPPPENAYLAERYRNERAGGGGKGGDGPACSPCVLRTLGALLAAALLLGAAVAAALVVLRPSAPSFIVDRLSLRNASRPQQQQQQQHQTTTDYEFFLTAVNPNKLTALWYGKSAIVRLEHQGALLAKGGLGDPADGGEDATDFSALLHGAASSSGKGLRGSRVALRLTMDVAVQVHVGALGFGQRRLAVDCQITTGGLRKDVHISSQRCRSGFRDRD